MQSIQLGLHIKSFSLWCDPGFSRSFQVEVSAEVQLHFNIMIIGQTLSRHAYFKQWNVELM